MVRGVLVVLVAAALAGLASAGPAGAGPSCWERLVHDWSDGRISGTYPVSCYREALVRMPEDLQVYSSAPDDIEAALQRRVHREAATRSLAVSSAPRNAATGGWGGAVPLLALAGAVALLLVVLAGLLAWRRRDGTGRRPI